MKRRCYLRQLILVLSCVLSFTLGFAQSKADKVKALLDAYSAAAQLNATVLVSCKGKILLHEGFGYKNATDKTVNTSASVFQIGSLTKQFTAAGILKLVEAGKLRVQDKLQRFFPELPKSDSITVKHLLTHTSGIFNYTNDKAFMKNVAAHSLSEKSLVDFLTTKPINFSPGSNYEYSNSGYMLLGYIIQKVSKKPYEQFIRETIFQPLRMTTSGFDFAHYSGTNKTKGYAVLNDTESKEAFVMDSSVSYSQVLFSVQPGTCSNGTRHCLPQPFWKRACFKKSLRRLKRNMVMDGGSIVFTEDRSFIMAVPFPGIGHIYSGNQRTVSALFS